MNAAPLALLALLAAGSPAPREWKPIVRPATPEDAHAPPPEAEPHDPARPPDGSKEDQALWTALRDDAATANVHLARLVQASYRIRYGKYYELLHGHSGDAEAKATALRARLEAAVASAQAAVPERPGVFQCRHVHLDFGQRMDAPRGSALAKQLPGMREEARACARKMSALVAAARPAADELDASLAAIDTWLGRARPLPPAGEKESASAEGANAALKEVRP